MSRRRRLALAVALTALLGACGGDDGGTAATTTVARETEPGTVVLKGNQFRPEHLTVSAGDAVTWEWDDGTIAHDVNGGGVFKSEIQTDGTFEYTFAEAGSFDYKCTVHPTMTGSVEVTE